VILKLVNASAGPKDVRINLSGAAVSRRSATASILASSDLKIENSLDQPTKLSPLQRQISIGPGQLSFKLEPSSLTVLRIPVK